MCATDTIYRHGGGGCLGNSLPTKVPMYLPVKPPKIMQASWQVSKGGSPFSGWQKDYYFFLQHYWSSKHELKCPPFLSLDKGWEKIFTLHCYPSYEALEGGGDVLENGGWDFGGYLWDVWERRRI